MSHIFISYSRRNLEFAQKIVDALAENELDTWVDWKSIPKGEDWLQEIYRGIEEAEALLFLISTDSVASAPCNLEILHAVKNGKRILPIFIESVGKKEVYGVTGNFVKEKAKEEINRRNFIFCRDGWDDFDKAIEEVRKTIRTDYQWLKYHTSLQVKALEWERGKDTGRLLRGKALKEAALQLVEAAEKKDPELTDVQKNYITTSKKIATRIRWTLIGVSVLTVITVLVLSIFSASQARISRARELATEAQTVLAEHPQLSLLLSVEALDSLHRSDPALLPVQQSLRDALLDTGGTMLGYGFSLNAPLVITPDSRWLAAGTSDGAVKLWNLADLNLANSSLTFPAHEGEIQALAASADSRWLVTAGEDLLVRLWDLSDPDQIGKNSIDLLLNDCSTSKLETSPDGHWLITVCDDDTVRIWDIEKGNPAVPPIALPAGTVPSSAGGFGPDTAFLVSDAQQMVAVSADSHWLALASGEFTFLWNLNSPGFSEEPIILHGHKFFTISLAFSPDSKWLATAGFDKTILLWDLTSSNPDTQPIILSDHFQVASIVFSPDGLWLAAAGSDGTIRSWNLASAYPAAAYTDTMVQSTILNAISVSPDQNWLVVAGDTVNLFEIFGPRFETPLTLSGYENSVRSISISPDSHWLATISGDTSVRLWDLASPQPHTSPIGLRLHSGYGTIKTITTSPVENKWLATSGGNGIALWDLALPDFYASPTVLGDEGTSLLSISPDNRWLAAGGRDGTVLLWDLNSLANNKAPIVLTGHQGDVTALTFNSDSRWLATASLDQNVFLWKLDEIKSQVTPILLPGQLENVSALSFSPNGDWLVGVGLQSSYLWDLSTIEDVNFPITLGDTDFPVGGAVFSPDNHWLAIGEENVRLLDLKNPDLKIKHVFKDVGVPVTFSPDGKWLATRSYNTPYLLKINKLNVDPIPLIGHEARVTGIVFSSDSRWLATGSWDNTARLWDLDAQDLATATVILPSPATWLPHVNLLATTPDAHWLVMGVEEGSVYLWPFEQDELRDLACKAAGRNLSKDEWEKYFPGEQYHTTCFQWPAE